MTVETQWKTGPDALAQKRPVWGTQPDSLATRRIGGLHAYRKRLRAELAARRTDAATYATSGTDAAACMVD